MIKKLLSRARAFALVLAVTAPVAQAALPFSLGGRELPSLAPMLEDATPAIVHIATEGRVTTRSPMANDPFFEYFFGTPRQQQKRTQGLGSGVIYDAKNGYIITNSHVIEDADLITITLRDGRSTSAKLIGTDPDADVAVLKIDLDHLEQLPLTDSEALRVGDFVVAIGNPFGLKQTVTSGIVSGLGRSGLGIEAYENFIQTDASINPGNSGGALVNLRGELVGINTAILGPNGGNIGIGFAIPINMAKSIADQLVTHGEVRRGRLGIGIQDLTPDLAKAFKLQRNGGAVISQVELGSPAHQAGVEVGDVITGVNGKSVRDASRLRNAVGLLRIGNEVKLDILRKRQQIQIVVAISDVDSVSQVTDTGARLSGVTLDSISIDGDHAVIISDIKSGSAASRSGLRKGDIILSINRQPVSNAAEVQTAMHSSESQTLFSIIRNGRGLYVLLQ